jgi:hypothetical protein
MLNNYTYTVTTADTDYELCSAAKGKELTVLSIMINGGEEGGDVTISIGDYQMAFTIAKEDTIVLDHKIVVTNSFPMKVKASAAGIKLCVSVAELDADSAPAN